MQETAILSNNTPVDKVPADNASETGPVPTAAVIDIGSNSIRLVVYRRDGSYPFPFFNERITCELGRGLDDTNYLAADRIEAALQVLARFGKLLTALHPTFVKIAATAAVRRADNAADFLRPATEILGHQIDVLPSSEEARLVTLGLTRNMPSINGLVVDLGGGSIEMVLVKDSVVVNSISLNIGHLSHLSKQEILEQVKAIDWLARARGKTLYGIGGSFRALGSAFIARTDYPLFLLHGLVIQRSDSKKLLKSLTAKNPDFEGIPAGRQKTMKMAAKIIKMVKKTARTEDLFVSGTSLRDGLIADVQPVSDKARDQLLITAEQIALHTQRREGLTASLVELLMPVADYFQESGLAKIDGRKRNLKRLLEAACMLSEICWNESPDRRADLAVERILALPIFSVTHKERAWLALAIYHRYVGLKPHKPTMKLFSQILSRTERFSAQAVGMGMRFGLIFCGGVPDYLTLVTLWVEDGRLVCTLPETERTLMDVHSERRFKIFAKCCGLSADFKN